MKPASPQRHYGMDWLRIGAFVLLIFYHVGFNFTPWGYQTPTRGVVSWAEIPLLGLSPWRLSLLFAISGYASAALLAKDGGNTGPFFRNRLARLGIPLIFGLIVVVPPQPYMGLVNSGYEHGYLYYMLHDAFSFQKVRYEYVPRTMHLWFVVYLLAYTAGLCAVRAVLPQSGRDAIRKGAERVLSGPALLPLGILGVYLVREYLPHGWTDMHSILEDRAAHLHYGGMFLFGFLLRQSEALRQAIARQWKLAAVLAVAGFAWTAGDTMIFPGNTPTPPQWQGPLCFSKSVQSWSTVIALFGIADRFWNYDSKWRPTLAEAVFPVYIAHQTIMVFVSYWVRDKGLTALPEFLLLCSSVGIGSWLFYLVGREIGPLRPLIGLKRHRAPKRDNTPSGPELASSTT
ncbi:acyltransferase family protein [Novosphingobium mangrovi (ex Huang et al. 2023)]|uniref:Acyltransferase n=1 Tax=Novosphingobium mangrovi (ex Huang et al. 2023) TaxID=2976432 RepID=A0ABT2I6S8_9SPHN|nr:acyltransferase [Novosphingobium mangrovi (ex Huang et al. 2023)]MCT2400525.1 acyltransferase [Novosphingobium mangrovi (ex Huang et al. 2023)]